MTDTNTTPSNPYGIVRTALVQAFNIIRLMPRDIAGPLESSLKVHTPVSAKVKAFHHLYRLPAPSKYTPQTPERLAMRIGLITEELEEFFRDALNIQMYITYTSQDPETGCEVTSPCLLEHVQHTIANFDPVEAADAAGDSIYVWYGLFIELGLDLDAVINEIHASNLTKLGDDGQPIYRTDGKVLKGPHFMGPQLDMVLGPQLNLQGDIREFITPREESK